MRARACIIVIKYVCMYVGMKAGTYANMYIANIKMSTLNYKVYIHICIVKALLKCCSSTEGATISVYNV